MAVIANVMTPDVIRIPLARPSQPGSDYTILPRERIIAHGSAALPAVTNPDTASLSVTLSLGPEFAYRMGPMSFVIISSTATNNYELDGTIQIANYAGSAGVVGSIGQKNLAIQSPGRTNDLVGNQVVAYYISNPDSSLLMAGPTGNLSINPRVYNGTSTGQPAKTAYFTLELFSYDTEQFYNSIANTTVPIT